MSVTEKLKARLGSNIRESMGATRGDSPSPTPPTPTFHGGTDQYDGCSRVKDALAIEVDRIAPDPDQPRKEFDEDELHRLAESMKARGQLQPIRVRWDGTMAKWVIIAGERRWRASQRAGLATLLCIEHRGNPTPDDILEDQLVENCVRSDLKPVEQGRAFKALMDRRGWSQRDLAERLSIGLGSVNRALALLTLPADIQGQVDAGTVPASTAYEVSRIEDDAERREIIEKVAAGTMTRDQVAESVRQRSKPKGRGGKAKKITSKVIRTPSGPRVTVEWARGLSDEAIATALAEALEQIRDGQGRGEAA